MDTYTGKDRMIAALKGQYTDRVPATVMFGPYVANLIDCNLIDFYFDAKMHAKAHINAYEIFKPDSITICGDVYLDAEAFGAEVEFFKDANPHLKNTILSDKSKLDKLSIPDPKEHNRLRWYLDVCGRLNSECKDVTSGGGTTGPWTLAAYLRGIENLIFDTVDDPDFVHRLMRFTTEWSKIWTMAIRETGVGIGMGEASASCSVISPKIYKAFIKPYHQELINYFKEKRLYISLHICGYIDPIMEDILDTGIAMISIDSPSSLQKLVELSQGRTTIMGNVPTPLFADGTNEEIEATAKECIEIAARGSKYILCSGCEIPLNSRKENIDYFMAAANKYGRYE